MVLKILTVVAAGLLIAADDTKKEDKDKDAKNIIGTWTVVSMERDGQKASDEEAKGISVTFAAEGKVTVKTPDKEIAGTYKLNATKKVKQLTLEANDEKTLYGIYKLDGDKLTICAVDTSSDDRPTEFSTKEGSKARLVVLKREKK
jgi:uncharacterized protein (TIGR03067 family)